MKSPHTDRAKDFRAAPVRSLHTIRFVRKSNAVWNTGGVCRRVPTIIARVRHTHTHTPMWPRLLSALFSFGKDGRRSRPVRAIKVLRSAACAACTYIRIVKSRLLHTYSPFNGRAVDKRYKKRLSLLLLLLFFSPQPPTPLATERVLLLITNVFDLRLVHRTCTEHRRALNAVENSYNV